MFGLTNCVTQTQVEKLDYLHVVVKIRRTEFVNFNLCFCHLTAITDLPVCNSVCLCACLNGWKWCNCPPSSESVNKPNVSINTKKHQLLRHR